MQLHDNVKAVENKQKSKVDGEKMRAENASQRSHGKYLKKPPGALGHLIEIVNCFPSDDSQSGLKNPKALREDVESRDEAEADSSSRLDVAACMETQQMPAVLRDYVWRSEWKGSPFRVKPVTVHPDIVTAITGKMPKHPVQIYIPVLPGGFRRYCEVWDAYEKLHGIARYSTDPMKRWELLKLGKHDTVTSSISIDEGMVRERKSLFSQVIEGQDIEAARIRECAVCKRIFWAGRIDAQQCGAAKCKTVLSSRLNRNPELRELYNKARRTKRRKQKEAQEKTQSSTKKGK